MEEVQAQGYVAHNLEHVLLELHNDPTSTSAGLKGKGGETYHHGDHKNPIPIFLS